MINPAEAEALIHSNLAPFLTEDCPLLQAQGRVLRASLCADRDLPPYDRVTMDGFALRSDSLARLDASFRVLGTQAAGMRPLTLPDETDACVEVMTGAVLPHGADCVVPYEATTRDGERMSVRADHGVIRGSSVHRKGSDHRAGEIVVPAGSRLTGGAIAVAAAVGAATVPVAVQPDIAVIASGDELVEVEHPVAPHQIRRSNDYALRAALLTAGYARVHRLHLRDVQHEVDERLRQLLAEHDVVILAGGISKGKFDFVPAALDAQGVRKVFRGVAQKPGKPFWFGISQRNTPVFALPGNPVSAYTCLHRYVLPALAAACGEQPRPAIRVALTRPVTANRDLSLFVPVRLTSGPAAQLLAEPMPTNTSGDFAGLVGTDGFVELPPASQPHPAGYTAPFWAW